MLHSVIWLKHSRKMTNIFLVIRRSVVPNWARLRTLTKLDSAISWKFLASLDETHSFDPEKERKIK